MIYTTILHDIRRDLGLSLVEYCVLEEVRVLCANPKYDFWCVKSRNSMAKTLDLGRATIFRAIDSLLEKGLIEKNDAGHMRHTQKWQELLESQNETSTKMRPPQSQNDTSPQSQNDTQEEHSLELQEEEQIVIPKEYSQEVCEASESLFLGISKNVELFSRKFSKEDEKDFQPNSLGLEKIESWKPDIEKLMRIDKAEFWEVIGVLTFVFGGELLLKTGEKKIFRPYDTGKFNWFSNIQSGKKLRLQFPRLLGDARAHIIHQHSNAGKKEGGFGGLDLD